MKKNYYEKNKESIREKQKLYYEKNKDMFAKKNQKWREDNKEKVIDYREKNKEKRALQNKKWRDKNKEYLAKKQREYRRNNKEKHAEYEKERDRPDSYRKNFNEYKKEWNKKNPEKRQAYYQKRRSLLNDNNTLTAYDIINQRRKQDGFCYYCKKKLDNNGLGHIDHKIPLSKGGHNSKENIVISCCSCNLRKAQKTDDEYFDIIKRCN